MGPPRRWAQSPRPAHGSTGVPLAACCRPNRPTPPPAVSSQHAAVARRAHPRAGERRGSVLARDRVGVTVISPHHGIAANVRHASLNHQGRDLCLPLCGTPSETRSFKRRTTKPAHRHSPRRDRPAARASGSCRPNRPYGGPPADVRKRIPQRAGVVYLTVILRGVGSRLSDRGKSALRGFVRVDSSHATRVARGSPAAVERPVPTRSWPRPAGP